MEVPKSQFRNLIRTPDEQRAQAQEKLKEVSQMYEKHFLNEMVKAMRSTVSESGFVKVNQGERIFRDQLDQEYVGAWSQRGGIGLSDLIYDQLLQKFGPQLGLDPGSKALSKPQGPLPLNEAAEFRAKTNPSGNRITTQIERTLEQGAADSSSATSASSINQVTSPWAGKLLQKLDLGIDEHFLQIFHDNGLRSDLKWKGTLAQGIQPGAELAMGQPLGYLGHDPGPMTWAISSQNPVE